jgi:predicted TIM-barrel fold metal-dependent hydrolase
MMQRFKEECDVAVKSKNQTWLDRVIESAIEPDIPICDPHHHLWDKASARLQERYLIDEMIEDVGGHNVVSTVFVECSVFFKLNGSEDFRCVGETEAINGVAAMCASGIYGKTEIAKGIVGHVDLRRGDVVADVLDAHIAAGGGRFRGIRHGAVWHESPEIRNHRSNPTEGLLLQPDFQSGFKHLAPRGLAFDAWVLHTQIRDVIGLARKFPDTTIVLDHCGAPIGVGPYRGKRTEVMEAWKRDTAELARCENVVVKLGGLGLDYPGFDWHAQPMPPTSEELKAVSAPYMEHLIEKFGPSRCMFESNFPIDKHNFSYTVVWNAFKLLTQGYAKAERAALFHDTACRVYRL